MTKPVIKYLENGKKPGFKPVFRVLIRKPGQKTGFSKVGAWPILGPALRSETMFKVIFSPNNRILGHLGSFWAIGGHFG